MSRLVFSFGFESGLVNRLHAFDVLHAAAAVAEATALADSVAEVVELGSACVTATDDLELGDHRAVDGPLTLDADVVDDTANGDHLVDAAALAADQNALVHLDAFFLALDDADVHVDRVADVKARKVALKMLVGQAVEQLLGAHGVGLTSLKVCLFALGPTPSREGDGMPAAGAYSMA
jgi:hypothetical protein